MAHYTNTLEIAHPLPGVFAFLTSPSNLVKLAPPELNLELISAPESLILGSRLVWKGGRYGISQQISQEVTKFERDKLIVVEQKEGLFKSWVHTNHFEAIERGTRILEEIDVEPPGGLLGLVVTANAIRREMEKLMAFREGKLKEIFG